MKEYFLKQLKECTPLKQENVDSMRNNRINNFKPLGKDTIENITPKSSFGTPFKIGTIVLYFIENKNNTEQHIKVITLDELDKLEDYIYDGDVGSMPTFKKK